MACLLKLETYFEKGDENFEKIAAGEKKEKKKTATVRRS